MSCGEGAAAPPVVGLYAVFTATEHCAPAVQATSPENALASAVASGALGVARSGLAWVRRAADGPKAPWTVALPWQVSLTLPSRGMGQSWSLGATAPPLPGVAEQRALAAVISALPAHLLIMVDASALTIRVRRPDPTRYITTTVASIRPQGVTFHAPVEPTTADQINAAALAFAAPSEYTLTGVG